ncbi:hypothetical protein A3F37_02550 [Candidatus Saccharibacteria bacterium RIFCSPHIGHO2_12_FULL_41_12]|nr:MAG: hypothetical protein A3F37_02550 [Candidatus Saccharibacteria bacterium RIFCSPHIGHO2_12_FULL_41_12]
MKDAKIAPKTSEKADKLRKIFFFYLFDMSWKLAISFLTPFFVALVWANGEIPKIIAGVIGGLGVSIATIIHEVKKINKAVENV